MRILSSYKKIWYLYLPMVVLLVIGGLSYLQSFHSEKSVKAKGANRMVEIPPNIDEVIDSALAEKFDFVSWREAVSGPIVRFHRNFMLKDFDPAWKLDGIEIEPGESEFILQNSDYRYVKDGKGDKNIIVRLVECESIRIAHQMIFSSLKTVTHPDPPLDRPKGWDFGDVYKLGYWARDNCFIYVNDISEPSLDNEEVKKINEAIDYQLTHLPIPSSDTEKEKPEISKLAINVKSIPINSTATIDIEVTDPNENDDDLHYTFYVKGGRIFIKNGIYFFKAEEAGTHTLGLVVTNTKGLTAKKELNVKIVQ